MTLTLLVAAVVVAEVAAEDFGRASMFQIRWYKLVKHWQVVWIGFFMVFIQDRHVTGGISTIQVISMDNLLHLRDHPHQGREDFPQWEVLGGPLQVHFLVLLLQNLRVKICRTG